MSSNIILTIGASTGFGKVEMPNGSGSLRTVGDKMMAGVTKVFNETAKQLQAGVLQNFGLGN